MVTFPRAYQATNFPSKEELQRKTLELIIDAIMESELKNGQWSNKVTRQMLLPGEWRHIQILTK